MTEGWVPVPESVAESTSQEPVVEIAPTELFLPELVSDETMIGAGFNHWEQSTAYRDPEGYHTVYLGGINELRIILVEREAPEQMMYYHLGSFPGENPEDFVETKQSWEKLKEHFAEMADAGYRVDPSELEARLRDITEQEMERWLNGS